MSTTSGRELFQLTPGVKYDDYANSPVHRFYQMWQQMDCHADYATPNNPSGCLSDLFPWVETTIGAGSNGKPQPSPFTNLTTGEGSTAMAFYNVQQGDAPYMKELADQYTLSDNFHQSFEGGTGANHIMFGYADAMWYSDGKGNALTPPTNQIEDPNPQAGTNNYYAEDGYGDADGTGGGSYSACADISQPGVAPVVNYLQSLATPIDPRCEAGHYYLLNNYNPGLQRRRNPGQPISRRSLFLQRRKNTLAIRWPPPTFPTHTSAKAGTSTRQTQPERTPTTPIATFAIRSSTRPTS